MRVVFEAEDGEIFDSADECVAYEEKFKISFPMMGEFGIKVDRPPDAFFIYLRNDTDIKKFNERADEFCSYCKKQQITETGFYMWDRDGDTWMLIQEKIEDFYDKIVELQSMVERMKVEDANSRTEKERTV